LCPTDGNASADGRPFHALRISSHAHVAVVHVGEQFVLWLGAHHVALEGRVETECMIEIEVEGADDALREIDQLPVARKLDLPHD
jgi:hypothetical protein